MKYTTDEMISALEVIKGVCEGQLEQYDICLSCPFLSEIGECGITWTHPYEWRMIRPTDKLLK